MTQACFLVEPTCLVESLMGVSDTYWLGESWRKAEDLRLEGQCAAQGKQGLLPTIKRLRRGQWCPRKWVWGPGEAAV